MMANEKHRIIIDCDPGVDDAFALALAFAAGDRMDILGITCVAGNRSVRQTEWNARRLCTMANRLDIPVFAGCPRPLVYNDNAETPVHGEDGLGDITGIPDPAMEASQLHAVSFLIKTLMEEPEGSVTVCALGPLTNIAAAIVLEPRIAPRIKQLVFMGGAAFTVSSVRVSDLNFYFDPHAAHVVLSAGIPQVMFGLDATNQVRVTEDVMQSLEKRPDRWLKSWRR
jgi:purine nucleosidase